MGCVVLGPFGFAGGLSGLCTLINNTGVRVVRDGVGRMEIKWARSLVLLIGRGGVRGWRVHRGGIMG